MNLAPKPPRLRFATLGLAVAGAAASLLAAACGAPPPCEGADRGVVCGFTEDKVFASISGIDEAGHTASAKTLEDGHDAYMLYCYACHGINGDGKGPSSYGLRPPPRDFTKGIFKFARMTSSDDLPTDQDLRRIIRGGLEGTAMLDWDVPEVELDKIIQYIKTFAPQKWEKKKKSGEPVKTIDPFVPPPDPWIGKEAAAEQKGKELYHLKAECVNCHPAYDTKEAIYKLSVEANKRDPEMFKPITGFREDPYGSVAKDSSEYGVRLLPPDFTFHHVRSVRLGANKQTQLDDLFRVLAYGVYPIMPAWRGALPDEDIWAIVHYVRSLMALRFKPEARAMHERFLNQPKFEIPKPPEPKPAEEPADAAAVPDGGVK
jgi:mono/diheme cytochrome c family protein